VKERDANLDFADGAGKTKGLKKKLYHESNPGNCRWGAHAIAALGHDSATAKVKESKPKTDRETEGTCAGWQQEVDSGSKTQSQSGRHAPQAGCQASCGDSASRSRHKSVGLVVAHPRNHVTDISTTQAVG